MLPCYEKILYATDLSVNATHAFQHAVSLARHYRASIYLLHILPELDASLINYIASAMGEERLLQHELEHKSAIRKEISQRLRLFAQDELEDHAEDLERIAAIEVQQGNPVSQILATAERLDVDLIIIGSHGKGRLKYTFLGSVAEKLLRQSPRPMLVVPLQDVVE
ncbi:MAG: universal stress protein [Desulfuromonadaceae bacterium]|jgi:nucleotide-binding universal stress UspA family protein